MTSAYEFLNLGLILVPSEVCSRKKLKQLWLWYNRLAVLPASFGKLKRLEELYLNNNNFSIFPVEVCTLSKLRLLDLSNNRLNCLPPQVITLKVRKLILSNNEFKEFPREITQLKELEKLYFGWNQLSFLPASVCSMTKLQVLMVNNNKISVIPDEICELKSLQELNIECNQIIGVSASVKSYLKSLVSHCRDNPFRCPDNCNPTNTAASVTHTIVSIQSSTNENDVSSTGSTSITPSTNKTSPDNDDMYDCYRMNTQPCGIAVIINNTNFKRSAENPKSRQLTDRRGSETDAENLKSVFQKLGFNVLPYNNLSSEEMLQTLHTISLLDHSGWSCLVVCVLSHGKQGEIAGCNGVTVTIKQLAKAFTATNCPGLIKKPKLFFIQACQGESKHPGIPVPSSNESTRRNNPIGIRDALPSEGISVQECSSSSVNTRQLRTTENSPCTSVDRSNNTWNDDALPTTVPDEADFLYGLCTVPGYEAYRHPEPSKGSWYISKLVEVLERSAASKHLVDILTEVNNEVSKEGNPDYKQMPALHSHLTKKVQFRFYDKAI
ncbi:caspase-8-like [Ptychodera flava]|uniref:caspase-8-like n=1 Tax=Ptychodera flava TaxID=63121 RepID=UPI00396A458B